MAFNTKEQELIRWGIENGKSKEEIRSAIVRFRTGSTDSPTVPEEKAEPGIVERVTGQITQAGERVNQAISGKGEFAGRTPVRRGFEAASEAASAIPGVAKEVLPAPARKAIDKVGEAISSGVQWLADKIGSTEIAQKFVQDHPEAAKALEEVAGTAAAAGNVAGTVLATQGAATSAQKTVDAAASGAMKTAQGAVDAINRARPSTAALYQQSKELVKPTPTPQKALGEVLQGKTKDLKPGLKALGAIDTEGVKTFSQLSKKIDDSIGELSGQVDDFLAKDQTPIKLQDLTTKTTSASGAIVSRNYVETALNHLRELYEKTADDVGMANVDDVIKKAQGEGLTRLEVNDISRLYNVEFGQKAFSKIGDPLTSVNAQMYENIRKGLKDVARKGMGGSEAAATDKIISSLYNTKTLVQKNVEAVNKLQQKIAERGLLEKAGNLVSKYADVLTGGSIRGLIGGILPRGAGYKVMNALDLEERLAKNLEVIRKAIESGSDNAIIKAVKEIDNSIAEQIK